MIDLANPAMLQQLQTLANHQPEALQPLIQAIAQQNPQLAQALQSNPAAVLQLLQGMSEGGGPGGPPGAGGAFGDDEVEIPEWDDIGQEDKDNINQITAMGVPRERAIEVYFACGKNVELAVSVYFSQDDFD